MMESRLSGGRAALDLPRVAREIFEWDDEDVTLFRVTGSKSRIAELEQRVGRVVRQDLATDIATLAIGLLLGAFLGAITIPVGGIRFTLSSSVGLLLVGIALSTLRTRNPGLGGPFPEPARQLLEDLGLNVFIAILGLNAGRGVVSAMSAGALLPIDFHSEPLHRNHASFS